MLLDRHCASLRLIWLHYVSRTLNRSDRTEVRSRHSGRARVRACMRLSMPACLRVRLERRCAVLNAMCVDGGPSALRALFRPERTCRVGAAGPAVDGADARPHEGGASEPRLHRPARRALQDRAAPVPFHATCIAQRSPQSSRSHRPPPLIGAGARKARASSGALCNRACGRPCSGAALGRMTSACVTS